MLKEKTTLSAQEILKKLGIKEKEDTINLLETLIKDERINFLEETETFEYFLIRPLKLEDGDVTYILKVRESLGFELVKIQDFDQPFQVSIELIATQNGISSVLLSRVGQRDMLNLINLLGLFT